MSSANAIATVPSEVLRSMPAKREPRGEATDAVTPAAEPARAGAGEPVVDARWEAALDRATD